MRLVIDALPGSDRLTVSKPFRITDISASSLQRIINGSSSTGEFVVQDRIMSGEFSTTFVNDYQIRYQTIGYSSSSPVYTTSNPAIATVNNVGLVTHVSSGAVVITVTVENSSMSILLNMTESTSEEYVSFIRYTDDSLAKHVIDAVDSRLVDKSASTSIRLFNTQNHSASTYVRNPSVWCADLLSVIGCLSPWNSSGGATRAGTLISPRHIIFAAHFQIDIGATVRFVSPSGEVINRTMVNRRRHPDYSPYFPDLTVGLLNEDVPLDYARILPADHSQKLPSINYVGVTRLPCLTLDQEEKALVTDLFSETLSTSFIAPTDPKRLEFYETKISGDSGNPAIMIINGIPVILTVWTYGGAGSGTSIRHFKDSVNAMMSELGGGYQLSEIDLSGFPSF